MDSIAAQRSAPTARQYTHRQKLEVSTNGGSFWSQRFSGSQFGDFLDLTDNGKEILAQTTKSLYYSTNGGAFWTKRG